MSTIPDKKTARANRLKAAMPPFFVALGLLIFGLLAGLYLGGGSMSEAPATGDSGDATASSQVWTCSMHPQIQQPNPGQCPICGMDLIPVSNDGGDEIGPRAFRTSEAARALMNVQTAEVERRFVTKNVRMVGKIDFDETGLGHITAWVPGRIDRLFVDYTGVQVKKGDHLVELYSPELLTAQDELLRSAKAVREMREGAPEVLHKTAASTLKATRAKLRRWGLTDAQIAKAEEEGITSDHVTIYAPMAGTVIDRVGQEGMYVEEGTRVYTIADLSTLWVMLDAYESDLTWLHYGQTVTFETEAYPGETFEGKISFIDPVLNKDTRTVKVRVVVPNPENRLKPEMFVRAVVEARVATGGRVMDPELAGKWISPMHPEVVKSGPGSCDVCGMALVRAEELGYVPATATEEDMPLVIPASAPLITGTRAIVYVEKPDAEKPTFEGRTIRLGPRAGDYYIVEEGLEAGERVVTRGNFKIDSALQIQAKTSMMLPEDVAGGDHDHGHDDRRFEVDAAFINQIGDLYDAYQAVTKGLAEDDLDAATAALDPLRGAVDAVDMALVEGDAHHRWMDLARNFKKAIDQMKSAGTIEAQRNELAGLSEAMLGAVRAFGLPESKSAYRVHCPMAVDNTGADWLQPTDTIVNPYMGSAMLQCGIVEESLTEESTSTPAAEGSTHKDMAHE